MSQSRDNPASKSLLASMTRPQQDTSVVQTYAKGQPDQAIRYAAGRRARDTNRELRQPSYFNSQALPRPNLSDWKSPSWLNDLNTFMTRYGHTRAADRQRRCSQRTTELRRIVLESTFRLCRNANRGLHTLSQFSPRLVPLILKLWSEEIAPGRPRQLPSTQVANFSVLRWFWAVHGVHVEPLQTFVEDPAERAVYKRSSVALTDKSWTGNGIDIDAIIRRAHDLDPVLARLLTLARTYGLRAKETMFMEPHRADQGDALLVDRGTKGGRPRAIRMDLFADENLALVIEQAKGELSPGEHAAWQGLTFKQARNRLYKLLQRLGVTKKQLGVTMHGLRAEFAIEALEKLGGVDAPVRGGLTIDYRALDEVRREVARALGHNRTKVTNAYYGSFSQMAQAASERFLKSWALLAPAVNQSMDLLLGLGIDNLWMVGAHARGAGLAEAPFEVMLDLETADRIARGELTLDLTQQIQRALESQLQRPVIVHVAVEGSLLARDWQDHAVPMLQAQAPRLTRTPH